MCAATQHSFLCTPDSIALCSPTAHCLQQHTHTQQRHITCTSHSRMFPHEKPWLPRACNMCTLAFHTMAADGESTSEALWSMASSSQRQVVSGRHRTCLQPWHTYGCFCFAIVLHAGGNSFGGDTPSGGSFFGGRTPFFRSHPSLVAIPSLGVIAFSLCVTGWFGKGHP